MLKSMLLALALTAPASAFAAPADADTPARAVVRLADLNLADPAGQATARERIRWAVERVCGPEPRLTDLSNYRARQVCVAAAADAATRGLPLVQASAR
jgi:UrcA family protein